MKEDSSPCICRLSRPASLISVCSDCLRFCSLWHQHCSLAVALSTCSRRNLSLAHSRLIGVELHGEESSVAFSRSIGVEFDSEGSIMSTCTEHYFEELQHVCNFEMHVYTFVSIHSIYIFSIWPHKDIHVRLQCSHASVGLAQACPN